MYIHIPHLNLIPRCAKLESTRLYRSLNIYKWNSNPKAGEPPARYISKQSRIQRHSTKLLEKPSKLSEDATTEDKDRDLIASDNQAPVTPAVRSTRMFYSDTLTSFFRRLCFSPDGSVLIAPYGIYKDDTKDRITSKISSNTAYIWSSRDMNWMKAQYLTCQGTISQ